MNSFTRLAVAALILVTGTYADLANGATISESVENADRAEANRERGL